MKANTSPLRLALWTLLIAGAASVAHAGSASLPIRHLEPSDALMALNIHVPGLAQECRISPVASKDPSSVGLRGVLDANCTSDAMIAKIRAAIESIDVAPPTHRFHVTVLGASREEGPVPDLSAGEVKALNDFKKVMTFRSFRVEAETVIQSDRGARSEMNKDYALELDINPSTGGSESIDVRRFQLVAINPSIAPSGAQSYPRYVETSFSIRKGETIVLGTSISDQLARVVLVTALP